MAHRHTIKKRGGKRSGKKSGKQSKTGKGRKTGKRRRTRGVGIGETYREVEGIPVGDNVVVASPSGVRSLSEFIAHRDREEGEDS